MKKVIEYKNYFIQATEYAAVACSQLRGCGNNEKADQAAVNASKLREASKHQLESNKNDINSIKEELTEIKGMLRQVLGSVMDDGR